MRVAFVTPFYYPEVKFGGPPKRLHAMAKELLARGHEVSVVTFHSERHSARHRAREENVSIQYVPWVGKSLRQVPRRFLEFRDVIARAQLVHCFGLYNLLCPLAAQMAARHGKPLVLEPMGMFVPRMANVGIKNLYHFCFTRRIAAVAARIVATSDLEMEELGSLAVPPKLVMRRNGLDVASFAGLPSGGPMRERWNVPANCRLVLYLGRISAKKNLLDLIRAFAMSAVRDARLVIAGPVSEARYLRQLHAEIAASEQNTRITVQPPVYGEDLEAALNAADLFVLPSINENFGNAAAEAVAAGVPVLLTDTCGIAPMIHRRAGLAVPLGVENLSNGLRKMLEPEFRKTVMAERESVKKELSWEEPVRQTEALYRDILASSK